MTIPQKERLLERFDANKDQKISKQFFLEKTLLPKKTNEIFNKILHWLHRLHRAEFCLIFRSFSGQWSFKKNWNYKCDFRKVQNPLWFTKTCFRYIVCCACSVTSFFHTRDCSWPRGSRCHVWLWYYDKASKPRMKCLDLVSSRTEETKIKKT